MPAQSNQSLIIGMHCLRQIVSATRPKGVRQLAAELGITPTRVSRLAGTLVEQGLVRQNAQRKFVPGPALYLMSLWGIGSSGILPAALPILQDLFQEGLTVALGAYWQGNVCFLIHERPGQPLGEALLTHRILPMERSSLGVALAAAAGDPVPRQLDPASPFRDREMLQAEFERVRASGYALLRFPGRVVSIGIALNLPGNLGLGVSGKRIGEESIPELVALVKEQGARMEASLAWAGRSAGT